MDDGTKTPRQSVVHGQLEPGPVTGEVLLQRSGDRIQSVSVVEHPRAHPLGEDLQDVVEALAGESHPDQAHRGGCEEEVADRRVDRPVGDVEQALLGGCRAQPGVQAGQIVGRDDEVIDRGVLVGLVHAE